MSVTITRSRAGFDVTFQYDPELVQLLRDVGGEWDKAKKVWRLPFDYSSLAQVINGSGTARVDDPKVRSWIAEQAGRVRMLEDVRGADDAVLEYELADRLYAYQRVGVDFMAHAESALLGDKMGLGKTVEAVAAIRELELRGKVQEQLYLVVCPNSMRHTWAREVKTWYPEAVDVFFVGERGCPAALDQPGFYVVNWEKTWRRPEIAKATWEVVVADESHRMKGRQTKQGKTVRAFKARHRFALSGTPIKNEVTDLWPQLNFVEPDRWRSFWKFFDRYVDYRDTYFGREVVGVRNEAELRGRLATVMLARSLDDVEIQLPALVKKRVTVDLTRQQRKAYDEMRDEFVTWVQGADDATFAANWLTQVLRLKQIAGSLGIFSSTERDSAKIDALLDLIDEAANEKFVVMSQFRTMVDEVTHRLREAEIGYCEMTGQSCHAWIPKVGSHRASTRDELVSWFQRSDKPRVFIATTQTGGEGITLTAARRFVFLDLLWTPGDNEQAWHRVYRLGQTRTTFLYEVLARDTVDFSAVLPTLRSKEAVIKAVMEPPQQP